jgi:hypothetical protein
MSTTLVFSTKGRALPSAGKRPVPCRPHPILSRGGYSDGPGLNASFRFGCPRFPLLVPWYPYLLTNELLNKEG